MTTENKRARRMEVTAQVVENGSKLSIDFKVCATGEVFPLELAIASLSPEYVNLAILAGIVHKVQSAVSGTTTAEELAEGLAKELAQHQSGVFPTKPVAPVKASLIVKALAATFGENVSDDNVLREYAAIWASKTPEEKKELHGNKVLQGHLARMRYIAATERLEEAMVTEEDAELPSL
jgi:hypothetical protein